jgi:hypothetical protein
MTNTPYMFAINSGDNDFGMMFLPLVEHLGKVKNKKLLEDKAFIVAVVNQLVGSYYVLYQNPLEYNGLQLTTGAEYLENAEYVHTAKYLQIKERQVLIGDEVQKYIDECDGWCNSELFVNNNGYVYSV